MMQQKNSRKPPDWQLPAKKKSRLVVCVASLQHLRELSHFHFAAFAHAWFFVITIVACVLDHVFAVEPLLQPP